MPIHSKQAQVKNYTHIGIGELIVISMVVENWINFFLFLFIFFVRNCTTFSHSANSIEFQRAERPPENEDKRKNEMTKVKINENNNKNVPNEIKREIAAMKM